MSHSFFCFNVIVEVVTPACYCSRKCPDKNKYELWATFETSVARKGLPWIFEYSLRVEALIHSTLAFGTSWRPICWQKCEQLKVTVNVEEARIVSSDTSVPLVSPMVPRVAKLSWRSIKSRLLKPYSEVASKYVVVPNHVETSLWNITYLFGQVRGRRRGHCCLFQ